MKKKKNNINDKSSSIHKSVCVCVFFFSREELREDSHTHKYTQEKKKSSPISKTNRKQGFQKRL